MFGFNFPSWRSKTLEQDDLEAADTSSPPQRQPSTTKKRLHVDTSLISAPIPHNTPNSLTGFDVDDTRTHWPPQSSPVSATSSRAGPSNIAWLRKSESDSYEAEEEEVEEVVQKLPILYVPPPAVVRLEDPIHPLTRSVSSPASHTTYSSSPNPSPGPSRWNYMNPASAGSTHSLRLDTQHHRPMLSHGSNFSYPLMKPLSPIVEQDYISPSPFKTISLPSVSTADTPTDSTPQSATAPAPSLAGSRSTSSDRPSPAHSHPFISRPVNRSLSQTSHKSTASSSSSVQAAVSVLPPTDFRPAFSGYSASATSPTEGVLIRPRKSCPLPTIAAAGSSEEDDDGASFVTASDSTPTPGSRPLSFNEQRFSRRSVGTVTGACTPTSIHETSVPPLSYEEQRYSRRSPVSPNTADPRTSLPQVPAIAVPPPVVFTETEVSMIRSDDADADMASPRSPPSASDSFVHRRWDRDAYLNPNPSSRETPGPGSSSASAVKFKIKPKEHWWTEATPAFWAFWLGFVCPILWMIGGWHFTHLGEQPPRVTFWEFYLNLRFWKGMVCCGGRPGKGEEEAMCTSEPPRKWSWGRRRGKKDQKKKEKCRETDSTAGLSRNDSLRLPRWVTEKQSSDFRRARLNDPKRSLKGIYFGYPFVARPQLPDEQSHREQLWDKAVHVLTKPNKCFDHIYGVKLTEVHGKPEAGRRIIDPWIQRCRYAFCYGMLLICAGLATGTAVLLIYNTRNLRD